MTTLQSKNESALYDALAAAHRSPEIPEADDVYGWLAGSWELDIVRYARIDTSGQRIKGEVHFGWVLEGRAIQDVWIMPTRSERSGTVAKTNNMYGITLRVWDPSIQAWRITWVNPVTMHREQQIGRRIGTDIVQIGARSDGTPTRWMYTEITPDSFRWTGEALDQDGKTWIMEAEFRGISARCARDINGHRYHA